MAQRLLNAVAFTPSAGGTSDFAVSAAIQGYVTPATAGAIDQQTYSYRAESSDKSQWEIGIGTYTASGTTLSRTVLASSNSNAAVNFTSAPNVYLVALAGDLPTDWLCSTNLVGTRQWTPGYTTFVTGAIATGTVHYVPILVKKWWTSCTVHVDITALNANASTVFALGIYDTANGQPGSRLAQATGLNGSTTGGATGDNSSGTLTPATPQPPGLYWAAYVCTNAAPTTENSNSSAVCWLMQQIAGASDSSDTTSGPKGYSQSSATLPATAGSLSLITTFAANLGVNC